MTTDRTRWRELTTDEDWDDVQAEGGLIVISDSAGPTKYHDPDCQHVAYANFATKVLRADAPPNGQYWWAPDEDAAIAGGATLCGSEEPGSPARGSQRQVQLYVNDHRGELDVAIRASLPDLAGRAIDWRSPLPQDNHREYHDAAFLTAVDRPDLVPHLATFWPRGGARWDALAAVEGGGVLLVEGKSYPGELRSTCKASPKSYNQIHDALVWTRGRLGGTPHPKTDWCAGYYQSANRLALLTWLRWRGVDAWLVHLLFTDRTTTAAQWVKTMATVDDELGLAGVAVPGAAHVLLPAR